MKNRRHVQGARATRGDFIPVYPGQWYSFRPFCMLQLRYNRWRCGIRGRDVDGVRTWSDGCMFWFSETGDPGRYHL